ncbi:hypothetical protein CQW49_23490 (plasmid) [Methylosinus trichosporium OB3b]|uniref:Uncharacterized protein n=1 Tax=Methylosinus trichosporium (strain ATCC 35070 / NCIMB 11131 / UNIQEM 75 / OB3b) TaxID=595536 RepID=A0A2D2D7H2_METT3|nr:hypothetical protein CQW49_23490 [Methylosinus trichosporium OB3b]
MQSLQCKRPRKAAPFRAAQSRLDDRIDKFPHGKMQNCGRLFVMSKRGGSGPAEGEVPMASSSLNVPSAASGVTQVLSQDEVCVGAAWPGPLRTQVFFVAAQTKGAVIAPVTALRASADGGTTVGVIDADSTARRAPRSWRSSPSSPRRAIRSY